MGLIIMVKAYTVKSGLLFDRFRKAWLCVQEADANIFFVFGVEYNLSEDEIVSMIYSNTITYVSRYVDGRRKVRMIINNGDDYNG